MRSYLVIVSVMNPYPIDKSITVQASSFETAASRGVRKIRKQFFARKKLGFIQARITAL